MRSIIFRGQRISDNEWVYGSLVCYYDDITPAICFQTENGNVKVMDWAYVKPETVGQYTGIKDSKGKNIYEGDVLFIKVGNYLEYNTCVIFENGAFWTIGENTNDHDTLLCAYINPISPLLEVNVIGNIHNNPELLKGDKNEKDNV